MKKVFKSLVCLAIVLGLLVIFAGCPETANMAEKNEEQNKDKIDTTVKIKPKGMSYFTFFDTVSYVYSYTDDTEEVFRENCEEVSGILGKYHRLFDIYYEHSGVVNLRTINLNAGGEPLKVDRELIDFLLYAKEMYNTTNGEMNIMMGSVLRLWHDCREEGDRIPTEEELAEANKHTDISLLEIDKENCTVRISDPEASIDVGALGKGYATEIAAKALEDKGINSYVLNIGGNIRIIGTKVDGSGWDTGIKNPLDPSTYAMYLTISDISCVTSGNYERYYIVNGERYHHIIDKDTLMPAQYFGSVSIFTHDSGLADALSTALFSMSYEDGLALVNKIGGVEVVWITNGGEIYKTDGIAALENHNYGKK